MVAAFSNGELRAFKGSTGSPLWSDWLAAHARTNSLANINSIKANPVIDGGTVYAVGHNDILVAIDVRTGTRIWERDIGSTNQPWVAGRMLFVLSNTNDLVALEAESGKIVWSTKIPLGTASDDKAGVFLSGSGVSRQPSAGCHIKRLRFCRFALYRTDYEFRNSG